MTNAHKTRETADAQLRRARELQNAGEPRGAIDAYTAALSLGAPAADVHLQLGVLHHTLFELARHDCEQLEYLLRLGRLPGIYRSVLADSGYLGAYSDRAPPALVRQPAAARARIARIAPWCSIRTSFMRAIGRGFAKATSTAASTSRCSTA